MKAAVAKTGPSVPPVPPPKTEVAPHVTMPIELLMTVRDEPDKHGLGYVFFSRGVTTENGLNVILNRSRVLISKSLVKADTVAISFYYRLLVAECCALRRMESPP